jgi:YVTN family beta-propeller protein
VHLTSGRVFVAHTANDTVEVIDGERAALERTLPGCAEGSGVLCTREPVERVFAASRGDGSLQVIHPLTLEVLRTITVGPRPNGLAWDPLRQHVLVADVDRYDARLIDPETGACLGVHQLAGRPRWCVYDAPRDRFLINVREPACVEALSGEDL